MIAVEEAEMLTVGVEAVTVNVCALDVPPPGAEVTTVIWAVVVAVKRSVERMVAVSSVELPNVVEREVPLKYTVDPLTKFVPVTVMMNCGSPTVLVVGLIEVVVGAGLETLTVAELLAVPPGPEQSRV